ncbi:hypothetical protein [Paludibacterium sp.]|uniref:hypothetical protein n=1 Tax=Paludibacterium sp. TaxID=1917523 RepID=UPI0025D30AF1|nr:hypothetical protein [Paludibacterium sp.]MBV8648451.1 hypothetical protein [Paludibacterium sp.]
MNDECQTLLAEVREMLAGADKLNETGQHGAAMEQAYHASEHVAAAYLLATTGRRMPSNDSTYDLFAKTIREPNRHPAALQTIREVVGDVCALREIYEPALLAETSPKDAQQMIDCVAALAGLVESTS